MSCPPGMGRGLLSVHDGSSPPQSTGAVPTHSTSNTLVEHLQHLATHVDGSEIVCSSPSCTLVLLTWGVRGVAAGELNLFKTGETASLHPGSRCVPVLPPPPSTPPSRCSAGSHIINKCQTEKCSFKLMMTTVFIFLVVSGMDGRCVCPS